ncbi:MAG: 30S ribosome-binding factor RbfA [Bacteroidota bacterium]|jgi:ribosome-binding factor A|nr:30S ribosome-binding factor RbfA [Bacteroidota bacterium]
MKESKRQQKFSKLIQKDLGDIFQQDVKNMFGRTFITVTSVKMSPDLSLAKVYLSFLQVNNSREMLEKISDQKKEIRKMLAQKIGKQVRIIPDLIFYFDDSAEYAAKMDELISGLNIPPADENNQGNTVVDDDD